MAFVQPEVELGQEGVGGVGAGDGPEVAGQRATEGGVDEGEQVRVDERLPVEDTQFLVPAVRDIQEPLLRVP